MSGAPSIHCPVDDTDYKLLELKSVYIMAFNAVPFKYLWVFCLCGKSHTLPPDELVREALDRGYQVVAAAGYPPTDSLWLEADAEAVVERFTLKLDAMTSNDILTELFEV